MTEFDTWLNKTLQDLNTDETVFGPYINGILEEENETETALIDLLEGVTDESTLEKLVKEILQKWSSINESQGAAGASGNPGQSEEDDVDAKLARLMESNIKTTAKQREYTEEEKQLRSRILDYGQLSDHEDDDPGAEGGGVPEEQTDPDLVKNTNVQDVQALKKERREQSRMESQLKKEKDKEDRERQKKQREEKKDKRKTVKQERRR